MNHVSPAVANLIERGAVIPNPAWVDVDPSIALDRISPDIVIRGPCRLNGETTSIGPGCVLGEEGAVTIENCQLADRVRLKGGFFSGATILSGVTFGSGAHVRPGTLLEEGVTCGHTVGLKQTVFMPFVAAGSLVNFCDALMGGGTSPENHSEIGSSYVHFNYTPHHDKATASLIGDVPKGVMLDQPPVFLGGQGGLIGPIRLAFGTVIAAGTICRKDVAEAGMIVVGERAASGRRRYEPGLYQDIRRILRNNFAYIGNLHALLAWYGTARACFVVAEPYEQACLEGATFRLREMIAERVQRLGELASNMERSLTLGVRRHGDALPDPPYALQRRFMEGWAELAPRLQRAPPPETGARNLEALLSAIAALSTSRRFLDAIRDLDPDARTAGTAWLQAIVDAYANLAEL